MAAPAALTPAELAELKSAPSGLTPAEEAELAGDNVPVDQSNARLASRGYTPAAFAGGAMVGAELGTPGGPLGVAIGGILGGGAGLLGAKGVDAVAGIGDQPTLSDIPEALQDSAVAEAFGSVINTAGKGLYEELSPQAKQMWDYARGKGIPLSLDQISNNAVIKFLGSAFRALPFTKSVAEEFDGRYLAKMVEEYKDLVRAGNPADAVKQKGMEIKDFLQSAISKNKESVDLAQKGVLDKVLEAHGSPFTYDELTIGDAAAINRYQEGLRKQEGQLWTALPFDKEAQIPVHKHIGEPAQKMLDEMAPYSQLPGTQKLIGDLRKASGAADKEDFVTLAQQRIDQTYKQYQVDASPPMKGFQAGGKPLEAAQISPLKRLADADLLGKGIDANDILNSPALVQGLEGRTMSFNDLQEMRSTALQMNRQLRGDTGLNTTLSRRWSQYADALDNAMQEGIKPYGDQATESLTTARTFSRYMHGVIDRDTFQGIINQQNPERIYNYIVKPGNITPIQETMKMFDPKTRANYQDRWLKEQLGVDDITPEYLEGVTKKWGNLTIDSLLTKKAAADWYALPSQLREVGPRLAENKLFQSILKSESGAGIIKTIVGNSLTDLQKFSNVEKLSAALSTTGENGKELIGQAVLADILKPDLHDNISGKAVDKMMNQYGEPLVNWLFDKPTQERLNNYSDTLYHVGANINAMTNVSRTAPSAMAARMLMQLLRHPILSSTAGGLGWVLAKGFYNEAITDAVMKGVLSNPYSAESMVATNLPRLFGGAFLGGGNRKPKLADIGLGESDSE